MIEYAFKNIFIKLISTSVGKDVAHAALAITRGK